MPIRAAFPSRIAFVATVLLCTSIPIASRSIRATSEIVSTAFSTPTMTSFGVEETLAPNNVPSLFTQTMSVNVPPTSTPTLTMRISEYISDEGRSLGPGRPSEVGRC